MIIVMQKTIPLTTIKIIVKPEANYLQRQQTPNTKK